MKKITLRHPLKTVNQATGDVIMEIKEVTVRRLLTGDLLSALDAAGENKPGTMMRHMASRATRLQLDQVDALELDDSAEIFETVESFLPASLRTGLLQSRSSQERSVTHTTSETGDQTS